MKYLIAILSILSLQSLQSQTYQVVDVFFKGTVKPIEKLNSMECCIFLFDD